VKTILVMDVPAEKGGALTILKQFYNEAVSDKSTYWIFVTSLPKLEELENIKNIRYPWVKKSWVHRYFFDNFIAPKLVAKFKVDEVLSLQNIIVPRVKVPQIVYVHQSLPFINRRFSLKEDKTLWIYQNIIGKQIFKSMKKAKRIIVQTEWMKEVSIQKVGVEKQKIILKTPKIDIEIKKKYEFNNESLRTFFYPASAEFYKNHKLIVDAAEILYERNIQNFKIILTLEGNESAYIDDLQKKVTINNLPIFFVGNLTYEKVLDHYSKSVLIFPSYIETFGLPMLEARMHESPVIASDMPFSHEILDGYERVKFFDSSDSETLAEHMETSINLANAQSVNYT
jgi:glycosyltransferase involved in cell wall biosynthesis